MTDERYPKRLCTICQQSQIETPATHVAENEVHLQWFECDGHGPNEHSEGPRIGLTPVAEFFQRMPWYKSEGSLSEDE